MKSTEATTICTYGVVMDNLFDESSFVCNGSKREYSHLHTTYLHFKLECARARTRFIFIIIIIGHVYFIWNLFHVLGKEIDWWCWCQNHPKNENNMSMRRRRRGRNSTSSNETHKCKWMNEQRTKRTRRKKWKNKIKIQYAKPHKLSECSSNSNSNDGSSIYAHNCTNYEHIYSVCILNNKIHAHRTYGIQRSLAFALRKSHNNSSERSGDQKSEAKNAYEFSCVWRGRNARRENWKLNQK